MSTRANIIVDDGVSRIQLYHHHDGYPGGEYGVLANLPVVLKFAWPLPRFEAKDFAAAIVRAWKPTRGGGIYIDGSCVLWEKIAGDAEWVYEIRRKRKGRELVVYVYSLLGDGLSHPIAVVPFSELKGVGLDW